MNIYVLLSLLFFLTPGGCPMYSIDLSTLEVPNDFQNELTLQSMLSSELHQYRNKLNENAKINVRSAFISPFENRGEMLYTNRNRFQDTSTEPEANSEQEESPKVSRSTSDDTIFLGTNLFSNFPKKCFSTEDIALMSARKNFESLIPKSYPQCMLSDSVVYMLMKYFNTVNQIIKHKGDDDTRRLLQRAFYDALGGYLRYYLLPVAQLSYYAGRLKLCTIERLVALYRQCKVVLNTNGNGWRTPVGDILGQLQCVRINPIKIEDCKNSENDAASCALLDQSYVTKKADIEQMIVTLPRLEPVDNNGFLGNIFVPFRQRRIYNLQSPNSAFILVKFFKIVTNCHRFQGLSQKAYNLKLRNWIRENVELHYKDEIFYPGLGGILQIYESLSCPKKTKGDKGEDQETIMGEEDSKDYTVTFDDINNDGEKCAKINNKADNNKKIIQSRKQSRSPKQGRNTKNIEREDSHKLVFGEVKNNHDDEDCIECDDEMYVAYVAAFLALLLLLLLLIICICMRKSDNERKKHTGVPVEKRPEKEEEPPPTYVAQQRPKSWSSLCRSKRKAKENAKYNRSRQSTKGIGFVDNRQEYYSRPLGYIDSARSRSSGKTDKTETDAELNESLTSTSSLGCHFPRKCIPIKLHRKERDEYYTTSEKSGPNKPTKVGGREKRQYRHETEDGQSSKQRDRFIAKPPGISEDQSSSRRKTSPTRKSQTSQSQKKTNETSPSRKSKRNERRTNFEDGSEPEKHCRTEEERLRKTCEEYKEQKRKEEQTKSKEKQPKVNESEVKAKKRAETRESGAESDYPSDLPKSRKTSSKDKRKSSYYSSGREKGGGNSKNSLSWETTFDDDSS